MILDYVEKRNEHIGRINRQLEYVPRYGRKQNNDEYVKVQSKAIQQDYYFGNREEINIKKLKKTNDIIRHLRNACSHRRIQPYKENSEYVYVWDENEKGEITYEQIFKVAELFEFIHEVDKYLKNDSVVKDTITEEDKKIALAKITELLHYRASLEALSTHSRKRK